MEPSARELAEMREKSRINLLIITTETEARAKAEGKIEAQRELIRKLISNGMKMEQVELFIGMKVEEIQKLLKET